MMNYERPWTLKWNQTRKIAKESANMAPRGELRKKRGGGDSKNGKIPIRADGSMDFNWEQCTLGVTASASRSTFTAALSRGQRFPFDR